MITKVSIENFKSISSLTLELGRLNVFIGANGSGKSNILEAIAMGSAAMDDKLDDAFLANRGVRITEPTMMRASFQKEDMKKDVRIRWSNEKIDWGLTLSNSNGHFNSWKAKGLVGSDHIIKVNGAEWVRLMEVAIEKEEDPKVKKELQSVIDLVKSTKGWLGVRWPNFFSPEPPIELPENEILIEGAPSDFSDFMIFAPENHFLRRFEEETSNKPLGIKGEGLFKLLTIIAREKPDQFEEIKTHLRLIDWFEDFSIPDDLKFTERRIQIRDVHLEDGIQFLDQRSANEGFLYLLFYLALFVSDDTPRFFAVDNIDNSLNPKLCSELVRVMAKLAQAHEKQVLLTTHNPVVLDGLNLSDDDQRLFVVYRNADGHTKTRRILPVQLKNGIEPVRLSEAFTRGYLGGLPKNF